MAETSRVVRSARLRGNPKIVVGLDGGQSSTSCAVADLSGNVLGIGFGGPSDHLHEPGGFERAEASVCGAVSDALMSAGMSRDREIEAAFFGVTGVHGSQGERADFYRSVVQRRFHVRSIDVDQDTANAWAAATGARPGVVLIAGTGSVAYGRDKWGTRRTVGGHGFLLGDEGSAYDIARQGLIAAIKGMDGRSPNTVLSEVLAARLEVVHALEIPKVVYGSLERKDIAALAPLVFEACAAGDSVALKIVEKAARELAELVVAVIRGLDFEGDHTLIGVTGGVTQSGDLLLGPLTRAIHVTHPSAQVTKSALEPVFGAVMLALSACGVAIDAQILLRLDETGRAAVQEDDRIRKE